MLAGGEVSSPSTSAPPLVSGRVRVGIRVGDVVTTLRDEIWLQFRQVVELSGMSRCNGKGGEFTLSERETVGWLLRDVPLTSSRLPVCR